MIDFREQADRAIGDAVEGFCPLCIVRLTVYDGPPVARAAAIATESSLVGWMKGSRISPRPRTGRAIARRLFLHRGESRLGYVVETAEYALVDAAIARAEANALVASH